MSRSNAPEKDTHPIPGLQTSESCNHPLNPSRVRLRSALCALCFLLVSRRVDGRGVVGNPVVRTWVSP
jgi:hypothetical protein